MTNAQRLEFVKALFSLSESLTNMQFCAENAWRSQEEWLEGIEHYFPSISKGSNIPDWLASQDVIQTIYKFAEESEQHLDTILLLRQEQSIQAAVQQLKEQVKSSIETYCIGLAESVQEILFLRDNCKHHHNDIGTKEFKNQLKKLSKLERSKGFDNEFDSYADSMKRSKWFYGEIIKLRKHLSDLFNAIPKENAFIELGSLLNFKTYILEINFDHKYSTEKKVAYFQVNLNTKINQTLKALSSDFRFLAELNLDLSHSSFEECLKKIDQCRCCVVQLLQENQSASLISGNLGLVWDSATGDLRHYSQDETESIKLQRNQLKIFDLLYLAYPEPVSEEQFAEIWCKKKYDRANLKNSLGEVNKKLTTLNLKILNPGNGKTEWVIFEQTD